jgi:zinc protease
MACALVATALVLIAPARAATVFKTPGGLTVWLQQDSTVPIISVSASFVGGAAFDPPALAGRADLAAAAMAEATTSRDARALDAALEAYAIRLNTSSGRTRVQVTLTTLTANRALAFELLREILLTPAFNPVDIDRLKQRRLSSLRRSESRPGTMAGQALRQMVFGGTVYATDPDGTPKTLAAVTEADLRNWYADTLRRDTLTIAVAGDIDAATLGPLLDQAFGALPAGGINANVLAPPGATTAVLEHIITDQPQSTILFGQTTVGRDHPDWLALAIANQVFGGPGFSTRLMSELREARGLTYGVNSALVPVNDFGLITGQTSVAAPTTDETIALLRALWADFVANGISVTEFEDARAYLNGSLAIRLDSTSDIARTLLFLAEYDLPPDYLTSRADLLGALTVDDVNGAISRHFNANALAIAVAGRADAVTAE